MAGVPLGCIPTAMSVVTSPHPQEEKRWRHHHEGSTRASGYVKVDYHIRAQGDSTANLAAARVALEAAGLSEWTAELKAMLAGPDGGLNYALLAVSTQAAVSTA